MNVYFASVMRASSLKLLTALAVLFITGLSAAQADTIIKPKTVISGNQAAKPFRVLTSGKHITIQAKKDISKIVVWTGTGHRFVEENNVNSSSYSFNVTIPARFFYIMLELKDGKRYTERVGVD